MENQRDEERRKLIFKIKSFPSPTLGVSGKAWEVKPPVPMECPANLNQALPLKTKIPWKYRVDVPWGICRVRLGVQDVPSVPSSVPTLGWRGRDGARAGSGLCSRGPMAAVPGDPMAAVPGNPTGSLPVEPVNEPPG